MKRPAYAREVAKRRPDGSDLFVGTGWRMWRGRNRIVIPVGSDLRDIDLRIVRGWSVIITHRQSDSGEWLLALARRILRHGPERLIFFDVDSRAVMFVRCNGFE